WRGGFCLRSGLLRFQFHGLIDRGEKFFYFKWSLQDVLITLFRRCAHHLRFLCIRFCLLKNPRQHNRLGSGRLNHFFDTRSVSKIGKNDVEPCRLQLRSEFFPTFGDTEVVTSLSHDDLKLREFDLVGTRRVGIQVIQNRGAIVRCVDRKKNASAQDEQFVTACPGWPRTKQQHHYGQ